MTSITLPRSKTNDGLAFSKTGSGTPLLFIHGVGLRAECWYQQIAAFKDSYTVFTIDMPGHGESDLFNKDEPKLYDFTEKVAKFIIDEIKQPAVIIGHSMGGLITLSLAKDYPELCLALVPMNTIYKRSEAAKKAVHSRAENLGKTENNIDDLCAPIPRWFSDNLSKEDELHAQMCRKWLISADVKGYAAAYKIFAFEDGPSTRSLSKIKSPTLFITGELDLNSNFSMAKTMAQITPNAESIIIEGSRHMTPLTHAIEVNRAVHDFLNRRLV